MDPQISFIIPCYRSENTIGAVVEEIDQTMRKRPEYSYEILLINDGSPDKVWEVIKELVDKKVADRHITGICLAKNFGQHCALMAGYREASGNIIVSLDDDGQTPANEVFTLIDKLNEGYDVVYAHYPEYKQTGFRRWGSKFAKGMTNYMLDVKEPFRGSSYFVMRRFVVEEIIRYDHPFAYLLGLVLRATRNIATVHVTHRRRIRGTSGYSLKTLVRLWLNGFTAFSVKPLEFGAYLGFLFAVFGFVFALITIVRKLLTPSIQMGWSSMMAALMIIGGILMLMLGMIGEYIGRIYICINHSPQYVIREIKK